MPDSRIKPAMDEIKAVLEKHELCGVIFVASATHTEFLYRLDAPWTCMKHEGSEGIRFRALLAEYPSKDAQKKAIEVSTGVIMGFSTVCTNTAAVFDQLALALGQKFEITNWNRRDG